MASYAIPVLGHYAMLACFLTTNMGICTWSYTEQQLSCQLGVTWSWHPLGMVRSERMVCGLLPDSVLTIDYRDIDIIPGSGCECRLNANNIDYGNIDVVPSSGCKCSKVTVLRHTSLAKLMLKLRHFLDQHRMRLCQQQHVQNKQ